MTFIDQVSGAAFDPTSTNWPEKACVKERFVCLQIRRHEDHVVAEEPALYWHLSDFLGAASYGKELKQLLSKATNIVHDRETFYGPMKYAIWTSEDGQSMFQLAYSELDATKRC